MRYAIVTVTGVVEVVASADSIYARAEVEVKRTGVAVIIINQGGEATLYPS